MPPQERITYEKQVQTQEIALSPSEENLDTAALSETEMKERDEKLRQKIIAEELPKLVDEQLKIASDQREQNSIKSNHVQLY